MLYRSKTNRIWAGVFGGLGEYLNVDPTILRLAWLIITVFTGFVLGLITYLLALLVIPEPK
ncbi:MAG: hypothetical protein A3F33_03090 [Candidatus Woykebacteria bacterium RIFCSPHIGHO2_12_FULL_43_10]|uniref:Phage shock protein PspC N-terminal domain-containing protein n=2 Tax=Candidatus Woykeibacteriota TaxID=1817899 RepID=A0A1G1WXQ2_9BACT|nr:MAG: hypothetical protein A2802_01710 [Candidatus Woykebacteria bacterium RIFCSPHIGHO2_01_FULL_43_29]OGY28753.1 MAG: hypothetical protein A3J50_01290 [Candidatus Woykebacteria bacterium RIFCSPHIGHO2_02_FULL_43_16b]OGY29805.1 MAG: hypothetical protein A3F33_03090 [Candidatus Woykebacteria bacterium RIFCSPHIGHO2_12_FULL_43_10]OGY32493.1 MAG: hypothetical protein A3A61_00815 [Candidatus Woykebacteria bacterium RIFCSPLOWO2_01_FULL_43_14]